MIKNRYRIGKEKKTIIEKKLKIVFGYFWVDKKLYCIFVRNKNLCFSRVSCIQFCLVPLPVFKSNMVLLELSNSVHYFLANQTHPKIIESSESILKAKTR